MTRSKKALKRTNLAPLVQDALNKIKLNPSEYGIDFKLEEVFTESE